MNIFKNKETICLQNQIDRLQRQMNELDEVNFNPLLLFDENYEIGKYDKENKNYYYLKEKHEGVYLFIKLEEKIISPDFKSKEELYLWIIENYKQINKNFREKQKKNKK